jgi:multisubunit Na+/H+ antiporter MnhF subunit
MTTAALVLLALGALACLGRLVLGPSLADRIVALDSLLMVVVTGIITTAARARSGVFADVVLVVALVGFVGTAVVARFIERRGG